jgi:hypothetical protein
MNSLTNKVVNVILIININIMKVELPRLNTAIKPSLISESVTGIRTNLQPCNARPEEMTHTPSQRAYMWPWFATSIKELGRVLPHPSACFPRDSLMGIRGWSIHYPDVLLGGMVGYRPTQ